MPMLTLRDGSKLFVRVLGRGQPVLLLHGFSLDSRQWLPLIAPYLHRYQFILPDCRGHGRSPTGEFNRMRAIDTLTADIEDVLDVLHIDRCLLGAYSMGAVVALHFALRWGKQRIIRYMHIEASPCFANNSTWNHGFSPLLRTEATRLLQLWQQNDLHDTTTLKAYRQLIHDLARLAFPQTWVQHLLGAVPSRLMQTLLPDPEFTREFFSFLLEQGYDVRSHIPQLDIPGLVLSGGKSEFFPSQGLAWMHEAWPDSEFISFPASGHGLMYTEPVKFRRAFDCFLTNRLKEANGSHQARSWLKFNLAR